MLQTAPSPISTTPFYFHRGLTCGERCGRMPDWWYRFYGFIMWCSLGLQLISSCSVSKQLAIRPGYCYELEDGTGSYKDFHSSRNNRFTFRKEADKIRIQHPSNILYFFNAPPDVTPEVFSKVRGVGLVLLCAVWDQPGWPKQTPAGSIDFLLVEVACNCVSLFTDLWGDWSQVSGECQHIYREK